MKSIHFTKTEWVLLLAAIVSLIVLLSGCGASREESSHEVRQDQSTVRTTTTATKTVAGDTGPVVAEVIQTVTTTEVVTKGETNGTGTSVTTIQPPAAIAAAGQVFSTVAKVATEGTPWGLVATTVTSLIGAGALAWGKGASERANAERRRAEEHKADASEGWKVALGTAKHGKEDSEDL